MSSNHIPQEVLSQQLGEKLDGRRVRTAVFTTYTFDPGFFEAHILPILFEKALPPGGESAPYTDGRRYAVIGRYRGLL